MLHKIQKIKLELVWP